jgi:hypothetical protein
LAFDRSSARSGARDTTPAAPGGAADLRIPHDQAPSTPAAAAPAPLAPLTVAPSARAWALLVSGTSRETLALLRRLASGIERSHAERVRDSLRALAERFGSLADVHPTDAPATVLEQLRTAERGAHHEADRLDDLVVVNSDRRAFLAALRELRDVVVPDHDDAPSDGSSAAPRDDQAGAAHRASGPNQSFTIA